MGLKRVTKKFLRFAIPTVIVLAIIQFSVTEVGQKDSNPFEGASLRCVIDLSSIETLRTGYLTDYNYDLLKLFTEENHATADISLADTAANYLDSLLRGRIDILVAPFPKEGINDSLISEDITDSTGTWILKKDRKKMKALNIWMTRFLHSEEYFEFYNRFFACYNPYRRARAKGVISPYDKLLQEYADSIEWDWKLLASLMWNESRFKISVRSKRGAEGLMQVMPGIAAKFGITDLLDPRENIKCAVKILGKLQNTLREYGIADSELAKYTLAAYNAGSGNIMNALELARSKKIDISKWSNFSAYFTGERKDTLAFKGLETMAYVRVVMGRYDIFRGAAAKDSGLEKKIEMEEQHIRLLSDSLSSDSLSRIDFGYEEAWNEEQEQDHDVRDSVGQKDSL